MDQPWTDDDSLANMLAELELVSDAYYLKGSTDAVVRTQSRLYAVARLVIDDQNALREDSDMRHVASAAGPRCLLPGDVVACAEEWCRMRAPAEIDRHLAAAVRRPARPARDVPTAGGFSSCVRCQRFVRRACCVPCGHVALCWTCAADPAAIECPACHAAATLIVAVHELPGRAPAQLGHIPM